MKKLLLIFAIFAIIGITLTGCPGDVCEYCGEDPCVCPDCPNCHEKPANCTCPDCDGCGNKPAFCVCCPDCNQYPCVCPCDVCDQFPCVCVPLDPAVIAMDNADFGSGATVTERLNITSKAELLAFFDRTTLNAGNYVLNITTTSINLGTDKLILAISSGTGRNISIRGSMSTTTISQTNASTDTPGNSILRVEKGEKVILRSVTLDGNTKDSVVHVRGAGSSLVIQDNNVTIKNGFPGVIVTGGTLTMNNGRIADSSTGVVIVDGGTFSMAGGSIASNEMGVYVTNQYDSGAGNSVFTMSGGTIQGNSDHGVYLGNFMASDDAKDSTDTYTFTMTGGNIYNNDRCGVILWNNSTFTMTGGFIYSNGDQGVHIGASTSTNMDGTFIMNNGNITTNGGSGVLIEGGSFTMSGGTISGNEGEFGGVSAAWFEDNPRAISFEKKATGGTIIGNGDTGANLNFAVNGYTEKDETEITRTTTVATNEALTVTIALDGTMTNTGTWDN